MYSIPTAEQKRSKSIVSYDDYSTNTSVYTHTSPTANPSTIAPPTLSSGSQENLIDSGDGATSSNHKVTIAVVDTSSLEETKKRLSNSDSWAEEFDQLEGLVNTLQDTVTSMGSLPQSSPSPSPLPPPKTTPPSVTLGNSVPLGAVVIGNMATACANYDSTDGGHMILNQITSDDNGESDDYNINTSSEEGSGPFAHEQCGSAKREDSFTPRMYDDKILYPLHDSETSSSGSQDSATRFKNSLSNGGLMEEEEDGEIQANFMELLQYGDKEDLSMV